MLPYRDSKFTLIALVTFFVIAVGYALYEARGQILGPTITVSNQNAQVNDQYIVISGEASRISSLSMNGEPIQVTENGDFSQPYLLAAGDNEIVLQAKDQYGRSREKAIEIMYVPTSSAATSGEPNATSTGKTLPAAPATSALNASSTGAMAQ